jgi:hypothetical protein
MKLLAAWILAAVVFSSSSSFAQSPIQKYAGVESLTVEQFADVVKSVWDELKKASDEYTVEMKSKNEFETSQEFQARIQHARDTYWGKIVKFNDDNKIADRLFPVLMKVDLRTYNADKQTYAIRSLSSVIVPPSGDRVAVTCIANPYVLIRESKKRGYKYAHIVVNTDPDFIWHVNNELARAAKTSEQYIFFKIWFRFDITQPLAGTTARLSVVPTKISLMNTGDNTVYWTDTISR